MSSKPVQKVLQKANGGSLSNQEET